MICFMFYCALPKYMEEFNLNRSVLSTHTLSATKLNVRPRFEPPILHCQSFMDFRTEEVQKFKAQKTTLALIHIRLSIALKWVVDDNCG